MADFHTMSGVGCAENDVPRCRGDDNSPFNVSVSTVCCLAIYCCTTNDKVDHTLGKGPMRDEA